VVELKIEHEEKIVVQCELIAGEFFNGVSVTKTLPINKVYDVNEAAIDDGTLFLIINDAKVIPLHYYESGVYKPMYDLMVRSNETFELYGTIGKKEIYSKTYIPNKPKIEGANFESDGYLSSVIKTNNKEVYGAIWLIANDVLSKPYDQAKDFYSISSIKEFNSSEEQLLRTVVLDEKYLVPFYSNKIFYQAFAFDESYRNYYFTKNNNTPIGNSFSQAGGPIEWNVIGDDVIGMFIGIAKSEWVSSQP
jgi:hypothetical protein